MPTPGVGDSYPSGPWTQFNIFGELIVFALLYFPMAVLGLTIPAPSGLLCALLFCLFFCPLNPLSLFLPCSHSPLSTSGGIYNAGVFICLLLFGGAIGRLYGETLNVMFPNGLSDETNPTVSLPSLWNTVEHTLRFWYPSMAQSSSSDSPLGG